MSRLSAEASVRYWPRRAREIIVIDSSSLLRLRLIATISPPLALIYLNFYVSWLWLHYYATLKFLIQF